jgi:hypothetical protein
MKSHQHQQNPNIPKQTTNKQTKTKNPHYNKHNTKTTKHPKIIPTTHTTKTKTKRHQNTHQEETLQKTTKARPTGLAQRQTISSNKNNKNKNSNKTTHLQTYIKNQRRPITHTTKTINHLKLTKPTSKKYKTMNTRTQNTYQKQDSKNKERKVKKTKNITIVTRLAKVTKQNTKQHTTKTIPHTPTQVYQFIQKQITPTQPEEPNKTFLNTHIHKYKIKQQIHQHQQNPKQPNNNQTKPNKPHLNTHNTNTTKHTITQPTTHTKQHKTTPEKHQNTHSMKEGKNLQKIKWARPTGLAQLQTKYLETKRQQNKNSNKTTPKQTNTTNSKHKHPITHTHNVTTHPKITQLILHKKTCKTTTTIQQNTHQEKDKTNLCKIKRARPNGLTQEQNKNKH